MIVSTVAVSRALIHSTSCGSPLVPKHRVNLFQVIRPRTHVRLDLKPLRCFNSSSFINQRVISKFQCIKKFSIVLRLTRELRQAPKYLKDNYLCGVVKSCIAQFEYVLAYRIRRGQQLINLYAKLWDEMALKQFFQQIRRLVYRRSKEFLLGGATFVYDWKSSRITEEELKSHINELDICRFLRDRVNEDHTCICEQQESCNNEGDKGACWTPFIKQNDLIVWKKEHELIKGLYSYKMYGKYLDVTAKDFLTVFLDTENRTKWDKHVVQLKIIDTEPSTNSDIIYWETKWPKLFSNRDYVFTRRYIVDESEKVIIVMNRSATHPDYPAQPSKSRVTEYWSYMVIKPIAGFDQPGIEFSLTYFDNPGMSVPSAISLWVSSTGMPEYIKRLRVEALKVSEERQTVEDSDRKTEQDDQLQEEPEDSESKDSTTKEPTPAQPPTEGSRAGESGPEDSAASGDNTENEPPCVPPPKGDTSLEPFFIWGAFMDRISSKAKTRKLNLET